MPRTKSIGIGIAKNKNEYKIIEKTTATKKMLAERKINTPRPPNEEKQNASEQTSET